MRIRIDHELYNVTNVRTTGYLPEIATEEGPSFILAANGSCDPSQMSTCEDNCAGCKAEEYWRDMAANDSEEFRCLLGDENVLRLALGQGASPGRIHVNTLDEWFKLSKVAPEELWATYDGDECRVQRAGIVCRDLDFTPTVAYRSN